ncbi:glutathione S-transferase-like isoform X2 [Trichoplusia ni]|uniref:glutathione transferase n=1 Tax=Trichoplusia ni TaxID=7111 RepID=A0A7E5VVC4_TRINI|nr:glutathione S-transferase-like isoform X2 [Trichoplusia ni]
MAKKLHYFNVNGLAEAIRYILHYTKQEFEDVRHDLATWPDEEFKKTLPFGQLPIYLEGDKVLNQSLAITKYVARDSDLIPADHWQQAVLDSTVYNIYDFVKSFEQYNQEKDETKKEALRKVIVEETIDFYFSRFEKHLADNGGFFIGKLSWAEFILVGVIEGFNIFLGIEIEKNYPTVKKLVEKITHLPLVKEYIASRGPYKAPQLRK